MIQIIVTYNDHQIMYYPVPPEQGWRIDNATRQIIIGRGVPRTHVPLDQVRSYTLERFDGEERKDARLLAS